MHRCTVVLIYDCDEYDTESCHVVDTAKLVCVFCRHGKKTKTSSEKRSQSPEIHGSVLHGKLMMDDEFRWEL